MGCIEFLVDDFVADRRPAHFAAEGDGKPVFLKQPVFLGHDDGGGVVKRDEADAQRGLRWSGSDDLSAR